MKQTARVLTETYQPRSGGDRLQRTFSPEGNAQVPANVPALVSGVVPAAPAPEPAVPAASSPSQSGNGASSQSGK
jgi:anti-sigma factor RsiW